MTGRTPPAARVHAPGAAVEAVAYDFERPELIGGALRTRLQTALDAWGKQLGLHVTAKTRQVVDAETAPFQIQSFGAFVASADTPCVHAVAALPGFPRAAYRVPVLEARTWAARMIGASGVGIDPAAPLTAVERALARRVLEEHLAEVRHATDGLLPEPALESVSGEAPAGLDEDALAVVVPVVLVRRGERRRVALALPVDAALEALGAGAAVQDPALVTARVGRHLAAVDVEIALRFDPTRVGPSTVLDLAPGDLIPLAHPAHRPLVLALDGSPVLRAAVGGTGERLACVVVDPNGGHS